MTLWWDWDITHWWIREGGSQKRSLECPDHGEPSPHWQLGLEAQQRLWGKEVPCTCSAQQCGC